MHPKFHYLNGYGHVVSHKIIGMCLLCQSENSKWASTKLFGETGLLYFDVENEGLWRQSTPGTIILSFGLNQFSHLWGDFLY